MNNTVASGQIRIDADVSSAVANLRGLSTSLNSLIPGGNAASEAFRRLSYGFNQIVQGISRGVFIGLTDGVRSFVDAGVEMAKTVESSAVAFETLLGSAEDAQKLIVDIQKNAVTTPFDVDALTLSTQKLALITRNGAQAEQTTLDLGKALAAAGRGTAELNRMATNLQQIGTNAYISARDIREFGNAGIDIVNIVAKYSDAFKETGKEASQVTEWLQSISDPYTVITNALHAAANGSGEFAEIYTKGMTTMKQVTENMSDAVGIFSYRLIDQSKAIDVAKSAMMKFTDLLTDDTFAANAAAALGHLVDVIDDLKIVEPIIDGIKKVVSAFGNGQFNNVIVFFQSLGKALSQFAGFRVIANTFKVFFDLFSNNHTAEEVQKIATQIGNLIRVILEFKMAVKIGAYFSNLATTVYGLGQSLMTLKSIFATASVSASIFKTSLFASVGAVAAVIVALSALSNNSPAEFFESLLSGVKNFAEGLANIVKDFFSIGWNMIAGLWNGIKEALDVVFSRIGEAANQIVGAFKKAFGIHSPSTRMRDEVGQYIDLGIAVGIRQYYGYIAVAAEEVLEKLVDLQSEYVKELADFGALDLVQQVKVYKEFASLYAKGTKARLEMDAKVHDAETAITKEIIDLVEKFNKEFTKAYTSAKEYYDMFEYTQSTLRRTTASVIEGLKRQNNNMTKYYQNLLKISKLGLDSDFMAYLYEQGMDAASEVAGLADATAEEIAQINELWKTRGETATQIAVLNTKELKEETLQQIDYLQSGLETKVVDVYDTGTLLAYNFTRGIYDMMPTIADALAEVVATASKSASDAATESTGTDAFEATLGDLEEVTADLHDMEIQAFDTADIFSLIKNVLSGIPWWAWAAGAGLLVLNITSALQKAAETAQIQRNLANLPSLLGNIGTSAQKSGKAVASAAKTYEGQVSQAVKDSFAERAYIQKVWETDTIKSMNFTHTKTITRLNNATDTVKNVFGNIRDIIGTAVKDAAGTIFDSIKYILQEMLGFIKDAFADILKNLRSMIKEVLKLIQNLAKDIGSTLNSLFKTILNTVEKMIKTLATTLEKMVPSIKSILNSVEQVVRTLINKITNIINQVIRSAAKILKTIGKGVGEAIQALIKPLSDPKLIVGAGVLVLVATALLEVALAAQIFSNVSLDAIVNMGVFAVALYALSFAMAGLGMVAGQALAGAIAMAATGAALAIAALSLGLASDAVEKINYINLVMLTACLSVAAIAMGIMGKFAVYIGIGAIATAAIGAGLAVAALCLGLASNAVNSINYGNLVSLMACLTIAGFIMSFVQGWTWAITLGAIATAAIGAGLAVAAVLLGVASQAVNSIDYGNLALLALDIALAAIILGIIGGFAKFVAIGAVVAAVIGVGMVVAAVCLATAAETGGNIDMDKLWHLSECLSVAAVILGIIGTFSVFAAAGAIASMVIGAGMLVAAVCLQETCNHTDGIDIDKLWKVEEALSIAAVIMGIIGTFAVFSAAGAIATMVISGGLLVAAVCLAEASKSADGIDIDKLYKIEEAISVMDLIMAGCLIPALLGVPAALATMAIAASVETIVNSIYNTVQKLNELDGILAEGETAKEKMTEAIKLVIQIANFEDDQGNSLNSTKEGWFRAAYDGLKGGIENLAAVASGIEGILNSVKNIVEKLKEIDRVVASGSNATQQMDKAIKLVIQIAQFKGDGEETLSTQGDSWFTAAYDGLKGGVENLAKVAEGVDAIISSVKNLVTNLKDLSNSLPESQKVEDYVAQAINIVKVIAEFKDSEGNTLDTNGKWFSAAYEDLKNAVENIKAIAEAVSNIMTAVKNTVDILRGFESEEISVDKVKEYVDSANEIVKQFASIEVTQEGLDKTAEAVKNISEIATNVATVLEQAKKVVDNMTNFVGENEANFNNIIDESDNGYITRINKMLAAFGRLSAQNETENAYKNLSDNLTALSSSVSTVTSILENAKKMVDAVNAYDEATKDIDMDKKVQHINRMLAVIAGGTAYTDEEGNKWHQGITFPKDSAFSEDVTTKLGYVSTAMDKIKEIAEKVNSVPDTASKISGVEAIIKFISETMAQVPETVKAYSEDMQTIGESFANAFKNGWESTYESIAQAGANLQGQLWQALQNKMMDEYYQGQDLANHLISGINDQAFRMREAGSNLQGQFWLGIQVKLEDEYFQGRALSEAVTNGIYSHQSEWWQAGDDVAYGFAGGIYRNVWRVNDAMGFLSEVAINKLKDLLDINSPSRVMAKMGGYVVKGFAEGIKDGLADIEEAGEKIAEAVMDGYESTISPIDLTAFEARGVASQEGVGFGSSNKNTTINQYNNIYDRMDMSKALNELTWSVSRA